MATTRLELLMRCATIAANDFVADKPGLGWVMMVRSGERSLTMEFHSDHDEWLCTFPTAGWGGTIEEIAARFEAEVGT